MAKENSGAWGKTYSKIFSIIFFAILVVQLLSPDLSLSNISDHFLWRKALVQSFSAFRYTMGDKVFNAGLVGKDGWLYYSGDFSINDYQKTALMGPHRLEDLAGILNLLNESVTRHGGVLWVIIPPDKNTIYPQYMPVEIPVIGKSSRLDQLTEYLQEKTKLNILDLRPVFNPISRSSQLYYKTDAHWNCLGAYYASNELFAKIGVLYPEVQVHPLSDFQIGSTTDFSLDILAAMGLGSHEETVTLTPKFPTGTMSYGTYENNESIKVAVNSKKDLPNMMVLHDSFYTECLNQFIEPQFSKTLSVHYQSILLSDYIKLIDAEKPDVVIVEFAEREIEYFFKLVSRKAK